MYFGLNNKLKLLQVDDIFADLVTVHDNGDLEFDLYYTVKQSEVLPRNALTVAVTVISRNIQRPQLLASSLAGRIDRDWETV